MRNASKRDWRLVSYFRVFMLQGALQAIISWPIFLIFSRNINNDSSILVALAIIFFVIGFLFESIADQQMKKFKSDPDNSSKIMNKGLWKYSRHPNYFGDFLQWFAIFVLSLSTGSLLGVVAPAMMLFIFFKLTIRLLEKPQSKKDLATINISMKRICFFLGRVKQKTSSVNQSIFQPLVPS